MELNELLEKVKSALSEEKYDEVINFLSNDILHDRNNAELYCYRGFAWIRKRAYGEAIADFTQSIELNPEYVEAYYGRGNAQSENGNYAGAIADYTIITKLDKDDARAYYNRGINQYKIRNYDKAIADYTRAIALNLKTPGVYNNRGVAWDDRGDHRKAITDYNKAIKLNPKYANAYVNRGIVWDNKGDLDKAIYDYTTAIKINRKFAHAYYNRSIAMLERSATGDYLRAINDISNSIEFGYGEMTPFRMFCDDLNRIKRFIKSAQLKKMIEFSKHSENNIDEIKNHAKNNYSGMVVHYTKLSVVDVLVTSQYSKDTRMGGSYFHFYNAVYMNDPEEGKTVFRILNNINKSRMEGISKAFDNGKKEDPSSVYIGSFLPQVNHEDELIMWRTYGKDE
jgi:tetratricopeptide (TPR) repeat protein